MNLLPEPVPLDPPAGSPAAVEDAVHGTSSAARLLDELAERLAGARTPGWHGADAEAADDRRGRIARLAGDGAESLHRAALRLAGHADVLREVSARIAVLRAAQDEEFAVARGRVAVPFDPADPLAADPADVLAALCAADAGRAAQYRALMARLDDDTAETNRVLAGCAAVVSGTPRYDHDLATLRLAALLPAWGAPEIARRGHLLAVLIREDRIPAADVDDAVAADLDLATDPAYAAAFLAALGPGVAAAWLATAWGGDAADDPRTDLFARVLSGLDRDAAAPPWLAALLDDAEESGGAEAVIGGLGAVLARARATGLSGPPPALAVAWARTLIREERSTGSRAAVGTPPAGADPWASDPLVLLLDSLVEQRAALATAELMSSPDAWTVLLSHDWNDGGVLRDAVVTTAADAPAEVARPALRDALVALGTGLEDGDPDDWRLVGDVIHTVVPVLTEALLRHPDVLVRPLAGVATGTVDAVSVTVLRGLAVSVALVDEAVRDRIAQGLSGALHVALPDGPALPAVAVPAAFAAIREYGSRLADAMEQHRLQDEAEGRAFVWNWTFGLPFMVMSPVPVAGRVSGAVEAVVTRVLGTDGHFENSPDLGEHHTGGEVMAAAVEGRELDGLERGAVAREAVLAFVGTIGVLGTPVGPVAPDAPLHGEVAKALVGDLVGGAVTKRLGIRPPFDGVAGEAVVGGGEGLAGAFG